MWKDGADQWKQPVEFPRAFTPITLAIRSAAARRRAVRAGPTGQQPEGRKGEGFCFKPRRASAGTPSPETVAMFASEVDRAELQTSLRLWASNRCTKAAFAFVSQQELGFLARHQGFTEGVESLVSS